VDKKESFALKKPSILYKMLYGAVGKHPPSYAYIPGHEHYQYLIVGSGIAGLHCALELSKKRPHAKIGIAESSPYIGGRIDTFESEYGRWEGGAGRIHSSHKMIIDYVKKYNLTLVSLNGITEYKEVDLPIQQDTWPVVAKIIVMSLIKVKKNILALHTLKEILVLSQIFIDVQHYFSFFPYTSELMTLRADIALESLKKEMASSDNFYTIKEGWGELIKRIRLDLERRGVHIMVSQRLTQIKNATTPMELVFSKKTLKAERVILAVDSESLKNISPFHNLPVLKHLKMEPLLRIYQVFPRPGWFYHISRTVTNSPLRHIIPINANKGIIMSSYTDGKDTIVWKKILDKSEKLLENKLTGELRKLFSEIFIPDPIFTKTHYWKNGCTYWLPGLYDPVEAGIKVMTPIRRLPEVFVCGESYSMKQAWVEGALEHAEDMLKRYF
jgi:monoamine oxidase